MKTGTESQKQNQELFSKSCHAEAQNGQKKTKAERKRSFCSRRGSGKGQQPRKPVELWNFHNSKQLPSSGKRSHEETLAQRMKLKQNQVWRRDACRLSWNFQKETPESRIYVQSRCVIHYPSWRHCVIQRTPQRESHPPWTAMKLAAPLKVWTLKC